MTVWPAASAYFRQARSCVSSDVPSSACRVRRDSRVHNRSHVLPGSILARATSSARSSASMPSRFAYESSAFADAKSARILDKRSSHDLGGAASEQLTLRLRPDLAGFRRVPRPLRAGSRGHPRPPCCAAAPTSPRSPGPRLFSPTIGGGLAKRDSVGHLRCSSICDQVA